MTYLEGLTWADVEFALAYPIPKAWSEPWPAN